MAKNVAWLMGLDDKRAKEVEVEGQPEIIVWGNRTFYFRTAQLGTGYDHMRYAEIDPKRVARFEMSIEEQLAEMKKWELTDEEVEEMLK
jgi:hypothetical protein